MTAADTTTDAATGEGDGRNPVRRWLVAILAVQCAFALVLFGSDLARTLPDLINPSDAPALTEPVSPGDQTRRYRPTDLPRSPAPPGSRPLPPAEDMPSRLLFQPADWQDAPAMVLTGQIAPGDAARFDEALAAAAEPPAVVFLDSPGGSVSDALAIGRRLREIEAATRMGASDICLSACPYMLAGGVTRIVDEDAHVGVHQHYFGQNVALPAFLAVEDVQRGQGEVMAHLIAMGVDPSLMEKALLTPPNEIYLLLPEERSRYRLVTEPDEG